MVKHRLKKVVTLDEFKKQKQLGSPFPSTTTSEPVETKMEESKLPSRTPLRFKRLSERPVKEPTVQELTANSRGPVSFIGIKSDLMKLKNGSRKSYIAHRAPEIRSMSTSDKAKLYNFLKREGL